MEGTSFVDSYQDFDGVGQKFPLLPDPVPGVLFRSLFEFQQAFAKWKQGESYTFSQLTEDQIKAIREANEPYRVIAQKFGVSKSTIQRARAGLESGRRGRREGAKTKRGKLEIPRL